MLFFKKWLRNHPQFLLYFLIHIDVLVLCRKFELIPTNNFRVISILKIIFASFLSQAQTDIALAAVNSDGRGDVTDR